MPATLTNAAIALLGLMVAAWLYVSFTSFVSGSPTSDDDPHVMAVSRNFDRLHAWPRTATGPLAMSARTAVERLGAYELLFDFKDSIDAYLDVVRAAPARTFPHDRIAIRDGTGFDESAAGQRRQAEELLALTDLFTRDEAVNGIRCHPSHRAQLYHSQFVGRDATPLIALPAQAFIAVEIEYMIPRTEAEHLAALAPDSKHRGTRLRITWCDAAGRPLTNDAGASAHFKLEAMAANLWLRERIEDIAVPLGAKSVRFDLQLPAIDTMMLRNIRVFGAASKLDFTAAYAGTLNETGMQDNRRLNVAFPEITSTAEKFVARSLVIEVDELRELTVFRRDGSLREVHAGEGALLGRFHPAALIMRGGDGRLQSLHVMGADAIRIEREAAAARIICDIYLAADRSYEVFGRPSPTGERLVRNLGLTNRLPRAEMIATLTDGESIAFPRWHPHGRRATIIFTEHADRQTLDLDRVVMFGNREGAFAAGAGLVGLDIPISKTVFAVPLPLPTDRAPVESEMWASLQDPNFEAHIRTLLDMNYDMQLGLHTASAETDTVDITRPALERLAALGGDLWIDHGDDHNLDCLRRLGWDPNEPEFYMIPDLRIAGVRDAWSYRDIAGPELNCIRDDEPANLVFELPALADPNDADWSLRLFATRRLEFRPALFSGGLIDALIEQGGVCIVHCYFSFNRFRHIEYENDRPAKWSAWFHDDMAYLARRRNEGDLHIPTVGAWIDFVEAARGVEIRPDADGAIILTNRSGSAIDGFTLTVMKPGASQEANAIELSTHATAMHRDEGDRITVWFDLPPGEHRLCVQWSGE